jgi:hypothetical protein
MKLIALISQEQTGINFQIIWNKLIFNKFFHLRMLMK